MKCCSCETQMRRGLADWHFVCPSCGYEAGRLAAGINEAARQSMIDEDLRADALKPLRERNFTELVEVLARQVGPGRRALLDVGAGHGWFAGIAAGRFDVTGLEPDRVMCARARDRGIPLVEGYFPDALAADARFDVIAFNDVFEHLPDVSGMLAACGRHLYDGGFVLFNLPSSEGLFYRISRGLMRVGVTGPFERMWQVGLPSPHLHYFSRGSLLDLAGRHGFREVYSGELPAIAMRGLYDRTSYVAGAGRFRRLATTLGVLAAFPFTRLFKSDIAVVLVTKGGPAAY